MGVTARVVKEGMLDSDLLGFVGRLMEGLLIGQSAGDVERRLKRSNVEEQVANEELGFEKGLMDDGKLGLTSKLGGFIEGLVIGIVLGDTEGGFDGEELKTVDEKDESADGFMEGVTVGNVLGDSVGKLFGKVLCGLVGNINGGKVFVDPVRWT